MSASLYPVSPAGSTMSHFCISSTHSLSGLVFANAPPFTPCSWNLRLLQYRQSKCRPFSAHPHRNPKRPSVGPHTTSKEPSPSAAAFRSSSNATAGQLCPKSKKSRKSEGKAPPFFRDFGLWMGDFCVEGIKYPSENCVFGRTVVPVVGLEPTRHYSTR